MVFQLTIDPGEGGPKSGAMFSHKVGQIGHAGQFVQVWGGEVRGFENHGDVEVGASQLHGRATVLFPGGMKKVEIGI
jgi:hypothetical protein